MTAEEWGKRWAERFMLQPEQSQRKLIARLLEDGDDFIQRFWRDLAAEMGF